MLPPILHFGCVPGCKDKHSFLGMGAQEKRRFIEIFNAEFYTMG
jgi:hypothetical protein